MFWETCRKIKRFQRPAEAAKYSKSFTHNSKWAHCWILWLIPEVICDLCGSNREAFTRLVSFENCWLSTRVICSCRFYPSHNSRCCSKVYRVCRWLWTTKYHWCDGINCNNYLEKYDINKFIRSSFAMRFSCIIILASCSREVQRPYIITKLDTIFSRCKNTISRKVLTEVYTIYYLLYKYHPEKCIEDLPLLWQK